jgi:hypothetical protein
MIRRIIRGIIDVIRQEVAFYKTRVWLKSRAVRWAR